MAFARNWLKLKKIEGFDFDDNMDRKPMMVVGLLGPDPGLELISQTNPYTTGPFGNSPWRMDWSLIRSSMRGC